MNRYLLIVALCALCARPLPAQTDAAPAALAPAADHSSKVEQLEKQLRATQEYMFAEFGKLSKGEEKGGGRKPLFPLNSALQKNQLKMLIRAKYEYVEEGKNGSNARVAPVSGFSLANARFWFDGEINDKISYRFRTEFANNGNSVQLQEAYGTYQVVQDKLVFMLGQRQPKTTGNGPTEDWPFVDMLNSSDTLKWSQNDRGLGVSGRLFDRTLMYEAQIMNGNGSSNSDAANDNYEFLYSLMVKEEPLGEMSPSQNDIKFSPFSPGVAAAAARSRDKKSGSYRQDKIWYSGMAYLKWDGLYAKAMFASVDVDKQAGKAKDQYMWQINAGYAMRGPWAGHIIEPLVRYEDIDYNRGASGTREKRATVGVNYFLAEEKSRFALNYTIKREKGRSSIDNDVFQAMYVIRF